MKNLFGFMVSREPIESYFDYVLAHGIRHLEIDLKKDHSRLETFTPERIAAVRGFAERNGVSLSLHPPFNMNLCSRFFWVRRRHARYIKKCILLAHGLGARHITLHLGNFYRFAAWADPWEHAVRRLLNVLDRVVPTCEAHGVSLALENMIPIPAEAGYSFLGDSVKDFEYIFSFYESRRVKFCLDIGHANTAEGPLAYVEKLKDRIISVHFHDNEGQYDDHLDVGAGTVPWQPLMQALTETGFQGPYVSECFNSQPHEAIAKLETYI